MGTGRTAQGRPSRPLGVSLLALLQIFHSFWYVLIALGLLAFSSSTSDEGKSDLAGVALLLALAYFMLGVYGLWLARGYVKGFEWARRRGINVAEFAIVLLFIGILVFKGRIFVPDSPFWTIVGNIIIIWYLGRDKVRRYFASYSAVRR